MPQTKCAYVHSRDKGREVGRECQLPMSEGTWGRHTRLLSSHASCPVDILLLGKSASDLKNYTFKPQAQTQANFSSRSINERAVLHPRAGKTQLSWTCWNAAGFKVFWLYTDFVCGLTLKPPLFWAMSLSVIYSSPPLDFGPLKLRDVLFISMPPMGLSTLKVHHIGCLQLSKVIQVLNINPGLINCNNT